MGALSPFHMAAEQLLANALVLESTPGRGERVSATPDEGNVAETRCALASHATPGDRKHAVRGRFKQARPTGSTTPKGSQFVQMLASESSMTDCSERTFCHRSRPASIEPKSST